MRLNDFAVRVGMKGGKKVRVSVTQIKEVLRVVNKLTGGVVYKAIREMVYDNA